MPLSAVDNNHPRFCPDVHNQQTAIQALTTRGNQIGDFIFWQNEDLEQVQFTYVKKPLRKPPAPVSIGILEEDEEVEDEVNSSNEFEYVSCYAQLAEWREKEEVLPALSTYLARKLTRCVVLDFDHTLTRIHTVLESEKLPKKADPFYYEKILSYPEDTRRVLAALSEQQNYIMLVTKNNNEKLITEALIALLSSTSFPLIQEIHLDKKKLKSMQNFKGNLLGRHEAEDGKLTQSSDNLPWDVVEFCLVNDDKNENKKAAEHGVKVFAARPNSNAHLLALNDYFHLNLPIQLSETIQPSNKIPKKYVKEIQGIRKRLAFSETEGSPDGANVRFFPLQSTAVKRSKYEEQEPGYSQTSDSNFNSP